MEEALWTTDLWRSYKKDTEERKMLEEELENWKDATFIRILASTATKHQRDKIASLLKKEEEECEKLWKRQLFLLCDREEVITLFGKFFTNLIDARTSAKKSAKAENSQEEKLHVLIDTRTKRGLPEDFSGGRKGLKRQKR